mgnify:CR=1 FL=1
MAERDELMVLELRGGRGQAVALEVVRVRDELHAQAAELGGEAWMVKAQVHAGGRGKAGGVKLLDSAEAVTLAVDDMLGSKLVTYQTNAQGQPINQVLIEEISNISRELYLGAVIDRASQRVVIMASTEGGMEIEKVAAETPEKILRPIFGSLNPHYFTSSLSIEDRP